MKKFIFVNLIILSLSSIYYAQSKFSIDLDGTMGLPTGLLSQNYKPGFGGSTTFIFDFAPTVEATISGGYIYLKSKSSNDEYITSIPFLIGARYSLFFNRKIRFYSSVELGVQFISKVNDIYLYDASGNPLPTQTETIKSNELGFALGLGVIFPIDKKTSVDINVKLNSVTPKYIPVSLVCINAGLLVYI
jgi:hypothetical protein